LPFKINEKIDRLGQAQGISAMAQATQDKILIIAPKIPRPDINSGDLRLSSILGILAQAYQVFFIATENRVGDDSYRAQLEQRGIKVLVEPFSLKTLLNSVRFQVAILEFYFTADHYLDRIRLMQPECLVVVDSVDVHYLRFKLKYDLTGQQADLAAYRETKQRELAAYRQADAVITVTGDDAAAIVAEIPGLRVELVPNIHEVCLSTAPAEEDTLIFVGGFSHPPNVDAVHYFCAEVLPLIVSARPQVRVLIVGSNPPEQIQALADRTVQVTGYVPETTPYLHRCAVSVAPLRYGAGMKGKIGEAMAHGIPVVTTSVGAQGMMLTHRKNVMIADTPRDFAAAVLELLNDGQLRAAIREHAVRVIDDNYTREQVARTIGAALGRIRALPPKRLRLSDKLSFFQEYVTRWVKARFSPC
jgi:O-antigen biosynthesis protein